MPGPFLVSTDDDEEEIHLQQVVHLGTGTPMAVSPRVAKVVPTLGPARVAKDATEVVARAMEDPKITGKVRIMARAMCQ